MPTSRPFFSKLQKVIKFYKLFCKLEAIEFKAQEQDAHKNFVNDHGAFHNNCNNVHLQQLMGSLKAKLNELENWKLLAKNLHSQLR